MVAVQGRIEPEIGELLLQAQTAAREALYQQKRRACDDPDRDISTEPPSLEQQQADALGLLAETALHHGIDPGPPGDRDQVVVHVDAPVLADPDRLASRCWKAASTFPRKRPGAWRATQAAW